MISDPVTADALFECGKCGDCCRGFGGTYVTRMDIDNIAAYTCISLKIILEKYCERSGSRIVLGRKEDGYCIFWDGLCTIHPVKPRMCRAWPFIENVLRAPENWRVMAEACPGIRPDFPESAVVSCVREKLAELDRNGTSAESDEDDQ